MITKNDWDDALNAWAEEERERLGGPPSPEEVMAYLDGELSGAAAERVRALLVYSPELTPLLDERVEKPQHKPLALRAYAVAATVVLALLLVNRPDREPAVASSHHEFSPLLTRGTGVTRELPAGEREYVITVVPSQPPDGEHEIEIARGTKRLWSAGGVHPIDDTFIVTIPGEFLDVGTYTLIVRGDDGVVDRYAFRVTPRR
ncbi:MAG TPA: hypothetical protein VF432_22890 [Thermoanaerobaculia bacterium]